MLIKSTCRPRLNPVLDRAEGYDIKLKFSYEQCAQAIIIILLNRLLIYILLLKAAKFSKKHFCQYAVFKLKLRKIRKGEIMKIIAKTNRLNDLVSNCLNAVTPQKTIEVLECFLVKVKDGKMEIQASDGKMRIVGSIDVEADSDLRFLVNARLFSNIVSHLPGEDINIVMNEDETMITVESEKTAYNLELHQGIYPEEEESEDLNAITLNAGVFKDMISATIFAVKKEAFDNVYGGLSIKYNQEDIEMAAIDGYRLAVAKSEIDEVKEDIESQIIVPHRAMTLLSRMLDDEDKEIKIVPRQGSVAFYYENYRLNSGVLSGTYMNYHSIYLSDWFCEIKVDRSRLLEAIERTCLVNLGSDVQRVEIEYDGDETLTVSAEASTAQASDRLQCEGVIKKPFKYLYRPKFVTDVLKVGNNEKATVRISASTATTITYDDENYYFLILPIRSTDE